MGIVHLISHEADSVVRRSLATVVKCHLDYRATGNTVCWFVRIDTCWDFMDAVHAGYDVAPDPFPLYSPYITSIGDVAGALLTAEMPRCPSCGDPGVGIVCPQEGCY